jgi:hypothetical protein
MTTFARCDCPLVKAIRGKVRSRTPAFQWPRSAENYDASRDQGLPPDVALTETLDCYPEAGLDTIKAILNHRASPG